MFQKSIEILVHKSGCEILLALFRATTESRLSSRIAAHDGSYTFEGKIENGCFRLKPIVQHHSFFLPNIDGSVTETKNGSHIKVNFSIARPVLILIWLITACCIGIGFPIALYQPVLIFLPFLLLIVLWSISTICFKTERREAEKRLLDLLNL